MSANAAYASTPRHAIAQCSAANTNFDGTGTIVALFTAGTDGSRIDQMYACAQGSTTAGQLKFFVRESSGSDWELITSIGVDAITVSASQAPWQWSASNLNIILEGGAQVGIATHNAESFVVHVNNAGDF